MDGPQQRKVIAAMPGGHGLALLRQQGDAALLEEEIPDLAAERGIRVLRLLCFKHLAEDADQIFLGCAMLLVQFFELPLARAWVRRMALVQGRSGSLILVGQVCYESARYYVAAATTIEFMASAYASTTAHSVPCKFASIGAYASGRFGSFTASVDTFWT